MLQQRFEEGGFEEYRKYYEEECENTTPVELESYEKPRIEFALKEVGGAITLDACCMDGAVTIMMAKIHALTNFVGLDIKRKFIERARAKLPDLDPDVAKRLKFVHGAVEDDIFQRSFDCIACSEAIEHALDLNRFLRHLVNYARSGGKLVLTTPLGFWDSPEHLREFTKDSLADELRRVPGIVDFDIQEVPDDKGNNRWLCVVGRVG